MYGSDYKSNQFGGQDRKGLPNLEINEKDNIFNEKEEDNEQPKVKVFFKDRSDSIEFEDQKILSETEMNEREFKDLFSNRVAARKEIIAKNEKKEKAKQEKEKRQFQKIKAGLKVKVKGVEVAGNIDLERKSQETSYTEIPMQGGQPMPNMNFGWDNQPIQQQLVQGNNLDRAYVNNNYPQPMPQQPMPQQPIQRPPMPQQMPRQQMPRQQMRYPQQPMQQPMMRQQIPQQPIQQPMQTNQAYNYGEEGIETVPKENKLLNAGMNLATAAVAGYMSGLAQNNQKLLKESIGMEGDEEIDVL